MTQTTAGIDPHQDSFTIGIVTETGVEVHHQSFTNNTAGFLESIEILRAHSVASVGVEGSASWGAHVAIALAAAGFDVRDVPPQRSAQQRRARRLEKTDRVDAISAARALLAEPTLGPAQALEIYDPLVAKIEAVLEHRRMLVEVRTLTLHYVQDQISKLPADIRDKLTTNGKTEGRLRRLETLDPKTASTVAGQYRLGWLITLIDRDRDARREIRALERELDLLLDVHGTTLREEPGVGADRRSDIAMRSW